MSFFAKAPGSSPAIFTAVGAFFSIWLASSACFAQTIPPSLPGWAASQDLADSSAQGVELPGKPASYSAPVIAEIDGNPDNGLEVAIGGADGYLHVVSSNGTVLWSKALPSINCPASAKNRLHSSPAVGDLFGNGVPYVLIGYGGVATKLCAGGVAAFRGSDGKMLWDFSVERHRRKNKYFAISHTVFGTPALADVDGDGKLEIGFGSFDRNIYLLNSRGKVIWYYNAADTSWSSPAFADVDGDGRLEMIVATDISQNKIINPPTANGGMLYAIKTNRRKVKQIPFRDSTAIIWQSEFDQVLFSSPVVAEVVASNPGEEVIIGSGCFFPENSNNKLGKWVKIVSLATGKLLRTLPTTACLPSSVAVADLDDDGALEIIATVNGNSKVGGDGKSRLVAWKGETGAELWSVIPRQSGSNDSYGGQFSSPVAADLDGNGSLEIAIHHSNAVLIFNGRDGTPYSCSEAHCSDNELKLSTRLTVRSTPAIGDLDGDGELEIVAAGRDKDSSNGALISWTGFSGILSSPAGFQIPKSLPWPMARGNARRSGKN